MTIGGDRLRRLSTVLFLRL